MNNYAELTIEGKKVGLLFGMIAAEEFYRLQLGKDLNALNNTQMLGEIIYAGAYNYAVVKRETPPSYEFMIDGFDGLYSDDEDVKQLHEALQVYNESRFGRNVQKASDNLKKKAEEESINQPISTPSESLHTAD